MKNFKVSNLLKQFSTCNLSGISVVLSMKKKSKLIFNAKYMFRNFALRSKASYSRRG